MQVLQNTAKCLSTFFFSIIGNFPWLPSSSQWGHENCFDVSFFKQSKSALASTPLDIIPSNNFHKYWLGNRFGATSPFVLCCLSKGSDVVKSFQELEKGLRSSTWLESRSAAPPQHKIMRSNTHWLKKNGTGMVTTVWQRCCRAPVCDCTVSVVIIIIIFIYICPDSVLCLMG